MARYHADLEHALLAEYSGPEYLIGQIQGVLDALGALSSYVNHGATVGILELDPGVKIEVAIGALGSFSGRPVLGEVVELSTLVSELRRVLVGENELMKTASGTAGAAERVFSLLQQSLHALFDELELEARELWAEDDSGRRENAFGYISDASVVLIGPARRFVLCAGWSD